MSTSWNGQICNDEGKYYIQFETDNKELYKFVETTCQTAMDIDRNPEIIDIFNEVSNNYIPEPCRNCSNHPSNGGSGFCNCMLGQPSITSNTLSTNPLKGYYAAPFTISEEGKIVYSESEEPPKYQAICKSCGKFAFHEDITSEGICIDCDKLQHPEDYDDKLTPEEFVETYCHNCGSQRCEGIGTVWFKGCRHKYELKEYEIHEL